MSTKRVVARNVVWNWGGMAARLMSGFLVAPMLVHRLGDETYGLWILIASMTGYFALLDLGVRGSVGRYIAFHRAADDREGVNSTLSTALAVLGGLAVAALAAMLLLAPALIRIFEIPPEQASAARVALTIVGFNLALHLILSLFDATLWAFQRFDTLNKIDIPIRLSVVGLTFWLVDARSGLVTLAWITLADTATTGLLKIACSFQADGGLRVGPSLVRRSVLRNIFGYGLWNFIISVGRLTTLNVSSFLIGSLLGLAALTPFSIARRLVEYASMILTSATGVLTPVATGFAAQDQGDRQTRMFLAGGKCCMAFALGVLSYFLLAGRSLIVLWIGPHLADASLLLMILMLGELLPMSQYAASSILMGMARNRMLALMSVVENVIGLGLLVVLARPYGLTGVCVALAVVAAGSRGLAQAWYTCRVLKISIGRYVREVVAPALAAIVPPTALLAGLVSLRPPGSWPLLIAYTGLYGAAFIASGAVMLLGRERLAQLATRLVARVRSSRFGPPLPVAVGCEGEAAQVSTIEEDEAAGSLSAPDHRPAAGGRLR